MTDFTVENHGSLLLIWPNTVEASKWLADHVEEEAQWFGPALSVEPRYLQSLVEGLREDGFSTN